MPKLVPSSSLYSLFPPPRFPVPLISVDVLSSDWCLHCYGLFPVDALSPSFILTHNSGSDCLTDPCLALKLCFSTVASVAFGSSCSARFYNLQPPFAWLFSISSSFLERLEPSLVLNVVFNCDRPQFVLLCYANCVFSNDPFVHCLEPYISCKAKEASPLAKVLSALVYPGLGPSSIAGSFGSLVVVEDKMTQT